MSSIAEFFAAIENGAWYSIDELASKLELQISKLTEVSELLAERGLLEFQEKPPRIRIKPMWKLLLPEEKLSERRTTVASFVIPPETSIDVQSTRISNLSGIELEVNLRINHRIKEVAIRV